MNNNKNEFSLSKFLKRNSKDKKKNGGCSKLFHNKSPTRENSSKQGPPSKQEGKSARYNRINNEPRVVNINLNYSKSIKMSNSTPKALNDFFYSSLYKNRDSLQTRLSTENMHSILGSARNKFESKDQSLSRSRSKKLINKLISGGKLKKSKSRENKYDSPTERNINDLDEALTKLGHSEIELNNDLFQSPKERKKKKNISCISPIELDEETIAPKTDPIVKYKKPPLMPPTYRNIKKFTGVENKRRKSTPLGTSKSHNVSATNLGFKSILDNSKGENGCVEIPINVGEKALNRRQTHHRRVKNNYSDLSSSLNKDLNKVLNSDTNSKIRIYIPKTKVDSRSTSREKQRYASDIEKKTNLWHTPYNSEQRQLVHYCQKSKNTKSQINFQNREQIKQFWGSGSSLLSGNLKEGNSRQVNSFRISASAKSLESDAKNSKSCSRDEEVVTQIERVENTSPFTGDEKKRLSKAFETIKIELANLRKFNLNLQDDSKKDKERIAELERCKLLFERAKTDNDSLLKQKETLSSKIFQMSQELHELKEFDKRRHLRKSQISMKEFTSSDIFRTKTPNIRDFMSNQNMEFRETRAMNKSLSSIHNRVKSPSRIIDPRKDSAIFQKYSNNYSIDKHLDEINFKEITAPKTSLFIRYIKHYGLNISSFYPGKGEKEIREDPNFKRNDKDVIRYNNIELNILNKNGVLSDLNPKDRLDFSKEQHEFVNFLANLQINEERQRLKAEEQSANVIDQMNRTINKLEEQNQLLKSKLKETNIPANNMGGIYSGDEDVIITDNNRIISSCTSPMELTLDLE